MWRVDRIGLELSGALPPREDGHPSQVIVGRSLLPSGEILQSPEPPGGYWVQRAFVNHDSQIVWLAINSDTDISYEDLGKFRLLTEDGKEWEGEVEGVVWPWSWPWDQRPFQLLPTYIDQETGEKRLIQVPSHLVPPDYGGPLRLVRSDGVEELSSSSAVYTAQALQLVGVQYGPFLRVVDVGENCLSIRAEPNTDAEVLACVAERVLLTDLDEAMGLDGTTWRRARTPAGIEGWSDSRYLE